MIDRELPAKAPGLSALQRTVLLRAISNILDGDESTHKHAGIVHVYACEIAQDYFEWPPPSTILCRKPPGMYDAQANRVHASICRAFKRLEDRRLGERVSGRLTLERWSGFRLNDRGIDVAKGFWNLDIIVSRYIRGQRTRAARVSRLLEQLDSTHTRN